MNDQIEWMKCRTSLSTINPEIDKVVYIWSIRTLSRELTERQYSITIKVSYIQRIWVLWNVCLHSDFTLFLHLWITCLNYMGCCIFVIILKKSCYTIIPQERFYWDFFIIIINSQSAALASTALSRGHMAMIQGQKCFAIRKWHLLLVCSYSNNKKRKKRRKHVVDGHSSVLWTEQLYWKVIFYK